MMAVFTIECAQCGETRTARLKSGDVLPFDPACSECLSMDFTIIEEGDDCSSNSEGNSCGESQTD